MSHRPLILGTRGSALALAQTEHVRALLRRAFPRLEIEIRIIKTSGDAMPSAALARSGVKGLFTKELEQALLHRKIDAAVHSLKDLPTRLPGGLAVGAVIQREESADILIGHPATRLDAPLRVNTSSPRRALQSSLLWPGCETREIRGNVETRLRKLCNGKPGDALLLAVAGLKRLDFLRGDAREGTLRFDPALGYRRLTLDEMIPAPGQGAIGMETRADDGETIERLKSVNHPSTRDAVTAERAFLERIGGGCAAPLAAHATVGLDGLRLNAVVRREDGSVWRGVKTGPRREAESLGQMLAEECLATGAPIPSSKCPP
ncbi:MAG: hydroxymethylbilane synthase [Verrucomicrobia bacterium]|nr:hydroxymethylbilane synthase [Verrucomicrobiota bacterium]